MNQPSPIPLHAIELAVSPALVGSKRALQFGDGPVHVSPAMYDLIRHATPDELQSLLKQIQILRLPAMPSLYDPLPMVTQPPAHDEFMKSFNARVFDV
jgi:hypothetical protein